MKSNKIQLHQSLSLAMQLFNALFLSLFRSPSLCVRTASIFEAFCVAYFRAGDLIIRIFHFIFSEKRKVFSARLSLRIF